MKVKSQFRINLFLPQKRMRQNWIVVTLAGILLAVVSLLTLHLHYEGIEEVLSQFQGHQLSYAKHLSNQIQFFIQARSRGLRALSSFPSLQYGDIKRQRLDIEAYANQIERVYVKTVSLLGELGTVAYSTDPNTIGLKKGERNVLSSGRLRVKTGGKSHSLPSFLSLNLLRLSLPSPCIERSWIRGIRSQGAPLQVFSPSL